MTNPKGKLIIFRGAKTKAQTSKTLLRIVQTSISLN